MKALKYIRIILAAVMLLGMCALLLDGLAWMLDDTNLVRHWLGWMPKVQLLPAILALNVVVVVAVLLVTFLIGRLYCSVVCPLGILQDLFIWIRKPILGKFHYRKPLNWLRYPFFALFVVLMVLGFFGIANGVAAVVAPYSAFARMTTGFFATGLPFIIAVVTVAVIFVVSFFFGRLWCNTLCPVGTLLGFISRYSLFGIRIDREKCVGCRKCEKRCKASCIDVDGRTVDGSRCVMCFNCLGHCKQGAIKIARKDFKDLKDTKDLKDSKDLKDPDRRRFLAVTAAVGTAAVLQAQEQKLDGGLAAIEQKSVPKRRFPLKPAGSYSLSNFESRCTACQLCVSKCPEHVLRPSTDLDGFMQPYMAFDQGYCRTACTRCSEVCPSGAIKPITKDQKTAISIGHAVVLADNCIGCGACARHCPSGAIIMTDGRPAVNETSCLGCGACEYYCPARPMTAIYVEGYMVRHVNLMKD